MRKFSTVFLVMIMGAVTAQASSISIDKIRKTTINDIVKLPIDGISAVESKGQILFISDNGRFVFSGEIYDLLKKKNLSTMSQLHDSAERIDIKNIKLDIDKLNTLSFGKGNKQVIVFVDPLSKVSIRLMKDAEKLINDYTFKFVVIPALGNKSNQQSKKLYCAVDKKNAVSAFISHTLDKLPQQKNCDLDGYDKTLLTARFLHIQGVPFIIAPDGHIGKGRPHDLRSFLGDKIDRNN